MKRHVLIYLAFTGLLLSGIYLIVNPYLVYQLYICVTVNYQTTCHYETVRSFKFPLLVTGVFGTISSIANIIVYTIVTLIVEKRKKRRRSLVYDGDNS